MHQCDEQKLLPSFKERVFGDTNVLKKGGFLARDLKKSCLINGSLFSQKFFRY